MRQHDALRIALSPRRVNDGRHGVLSKTGGALLETVSVGVIGEEPLPPARGDLGERHDLLGPRLAVCVHHDCRRQSRGPGANSHDLV